MESAWSCGEQATYVCGCVQSSPAVQLPYPALILFGLGDLESVTWHWPAWSQTYTWWQNICCIVNERISVQLNGCKGRTWNEWKSTWRLNGIEFFIELPVSGNCFWRTLAIRYSMRGIELPLFNALLLSTYTQRMKIAANVWYYVNGLGKGIWKDWMCIHTPNIVLL